MDNKYTNRKYGLGISEQATTSHPWGKGAVKRFTAKGLVKHAEKKGYSDKYIAKKLAAIASLNTTDAPMASAKLREASNIARARAHEKCEYKEDRQKMRA